MSIDPKYDLDNSNIKTPIFEGHIDYRKTPINTCIQFKSKTNKCYDPEVSNFKLNDIDTINNLNNTNYSNPKISEYEELVKALYNTSGFKADQDKPNLDLVLGDFPRALLAVGEVGTLGAKKYTEKGWLLVPRGITRYLSASLRHYFHYKEGELYDKETKILHLAHSAWNSLAALELYLRESQNNMISSKEEDHTDIK